MKKFLIPLFCVLLAVLACSSQTPSTTGVPVNEDESISSLTEESVETPESAETKETIKTDEPNDFESTVASFETEIETKNQVTVNEQVLLNKNDIVITLKSLDFDGFWGPAFKVLIENNSNKSVTVQTRESVVNGVMIDTIFSSDVASGKKANDEITFMDSDLEKASIELIKDIEFTFHIFDTESWDTILDTGTITITTSADPAYVQTYDDSGFVALDQNGIKIVIKKLDSEDSFWGADIYSYIENNSNKDVTIQIRDMSVNGFMIDPIFSSDVLSGKKAFDTITFFESDLTDNDIVTIETLEFYFHIFDLDSWDTIFDSQIIKLTFDE